MAKIRLDLSICPRGHGVAGVFIGDRRVTPKKCCGSWIAEHEWMVDAEKLIEAINDATRKNGRKNRSKIYGDVNA